MESDLQTLGYPVLMATAAKGALLQVSQSPALILIASQLGEESGFQLCHQLRTAGHQMPMLMLMTSDTVTDRAACLEAGADDYVLTPYERETLRHRLRLYLQSPNQPVGKQLQFADLTLDLTSRTATRGPHTIDLTMKEFELLKLLMETPGEVLTREAILDQVWGYAFMGESNVIEVYIRYLRLKLEAEAQKRLIQTVRGVGYVLREV